MRNRHIPDGDGLFRHVIYPQHYRKTGSARGAEASEFSSKSLMRIVDDKSDGTLHTSFAWCRCLPNFAHVHAYGCRNAFRQNAKLNRRTDRRKNAPPRVYCGAYKVTAKAIRDLVMIDDSGLSSITVRHKPEGREIAHVDAKFVPKPNLDIEGVKTEVSRQLWFAAHGPIKHKCRCDEHLSFHPSELLDDGPQGDCSDSRGWRLKAICVVRFYLLCTRYGYRHCMEAAEWELVGRKASKRCGIRNWKSKY